MNLSQWVTSHNLSQVFSKCSSKVNVVVKHGKYNYSCFVLQRELDTTSRTRAVWTHLARAHTEGSICLIWGCRDLHLELEVSICLSSWPTQEEHHNTASKKAQVPICKVEPTVWVCPLWDRGTDKMTWRGKKRNLSLKAEHTKEEKEWKGKREKGR